MNMTMEKYNRYCVYKRRDDLLGNPFIAQKDSDCDEIDKFLKIVDNYIHLSSYIELNK